MIGSRVVGLLKNVPRSNANKNFMKNFQQVRHSSNEMWSYRENAQPVEKWAKYSAAFVATYCWWWFYWNLYHGWGHISGDYYGKPLPEPSEWTDEELGIPSENVKL